MRLVRLGPNGRLPWLLWSVPLLGMARLVPASSSFGLWLRLLAATLVLLLPGRLVARALGRRSGVATLSWTLAMLAPALALTFAVRGSLWLVLGIVAGIAVLALPVAVRRAEEPAPRGRALAVAAGLGFGIALWHVAGIVHGDALFHQGRVRKLDDFGALSLRTVDEFRDGGLHPGYAFPLWHAFLGLVAKVGGVDPGAVVLHEPSVLAPLAFLILFELGLALFRSAWLGVAVLVASVSLYALAPGGGGAFATLALPGTMARQLLVPAVTAAFVAFVREPSPSLGLTLAVAWLDLMFIHPTDALFVAVPLVAFVVIRVALARADLRSGLAALAALAIPTALVLAWLAPLAAETASHTPDRAERLRGFDQYATQLVVDSLHRFHLRPEVFGRTGAVAVAALLLVPLAGLAANRRWAALVLGGSLALLALELSGWAFPRLSDAVSLSQARRAAGFVPFTVALAGGAAVLSRGLRVAVLPLALGSGIALQHWYPGDFGIELASGGPALATWIALYGGLAGLGAGFLLAGRRQLDRMGVLPGLAVLLFVLPVVVHGFRQWQPRVTGDPYMLSVGLVRELQTVVPRGDIVYADLETSYRISAAAPVYVANSPPAHVADTKANRPYRRRSEWLRFLETGNLAIPRARSARWLVLRRGELPGLRGHLLRVYGDDRFVLLRL